MSNRFAVILAAGKGTRMKSKLYKVLHPVMGRPMVQHVIGELQALDLKNIVTVVGFGAEQVSEVVGDASEFVIQEEQLGTAHAVEEAKRILDGKQGTTIVVCGDTPLITKDTFQELFEHHETSGAKATILTAQAENPSGYGRVIRNKQNEVTKIVEHKDASAEELLVQEINTGTYCFDNEALFYALKQVSNDNAQGEYYLPDVIEILRNEKELVTAFMTPNFEETLGINDRVALAEAEDILKRRINKNHMQNGVTIIDSANTYIGPDVEIGQDTVIQPGTSITGRSVIGTDCEIGPHSEIIDSQIGNETTVHQSVIKNSKIGNDVSIGPFAHIRPESNVSNDVRIGNFVEVKKTNIDQGSKVSHLSYIGDANIGKDVNVGCGTVTVNYDGEQKYETTIEDKVFVGCNTNLIAPVKIGKGAYVAAGSTITEDVPEESLSIARTRQTNKEGYARQMKKD